MANDDVEKVWTRFFDLCGGGYDKTPFKTIFIEGEENHAVEVFKARFGFSPYNCTCDCCGPDFSVCEVNGLDDWPGVGETLTIPAA